MGWAWMPFVVSLVLAGCTAPALRPSGPRLPAPVPFSILHTNDLHSHFTGTGPTLLFSPPVADGDPVRGHYARLAHLVRSLRESRQRNGVGVLTLDAGDFFSGTLFSSIAVAPASERLPEIEFMERLGYDGFTLGNHEFDLFDVGLMRMLEKAEQRRISTPLLLANASEGSTPLAQTLARLRAAQSGFVSRPYIVREFSNGNGGLLRVGVLGIQSPASNALSAINRREIQFEGYDDASHKQEWKLFVRFVADQVERLRRVEKVHVVVALMHGGRPEDERLANDVPGLDVIAASHTHDSYVTQVGDTVMAQAAPYGEELGVLDLVYDPSSGLVRPSTLPGSISSPIPVDDSVASEVDVLDFVEQLKESLHASLRDFPWDPDAIAAHFSQPMRIRRPGESGPDLGRWATTAIVRSLNRTENRPPVDVYLAASAALRGTIVLQGERETAYSYADLFRHVGFGGEEDGTPGLGVVDFYLTPSQLERVLQMGDGVHRLVEPHFFWLASEALQWEWRRWGLTRWPIPFLTGLGNITLQGAPLEAREKLVHIAVNTEIARTWQNLPGWGKWLMTPQDELGRPVENLLTRRVGKEFALLLGALE